MAVKLLVWIVVFIFTLTFFVSPCNIWAAASPSPQPSPSIEVIDVNALFWPVVPGKTVADGSFWLKQLKETFSGLFTFGEINKSKYEIDLSEKRFVEASKLFDSQDYKNGLKSLDLNKQARDQALKLKKQALEQKQDTLELTTKLVNSLEKQQRALTYLETKLPDNQKAKIEEILKDLKLQTSEAK